VLPEKSVYLTKKSYNVL